MSACARNTAAAPHRERVEVTTERVLTGFDYICCGDFILRFVYRNILSKLKPPVQPFSRKDLYLKTAQQILHFFLLVIEIVRT